MARQTFLRWGAGSVGSTSRTQPAGPSLYSTLSLCQPCRSQSPHRACGASQAAVLKHELQMCQHGAVRTGTHMFAMAAEPAFSYLKCKYKDTCTELAGECNR